MQVSELAARNSTALSRQNVAPYSVAAVNATLAALSRSVEHREIMETDNDDSTDAIAWQAASAQRNALRLSQVIKMILFPCVGKMWKSYFQDLC